MTIKVGWFGYGGSSWQAEVIRDALRNRGITLVTCHEHPNADVQYDADKIHEFIDSCDIMYVPARYFIQPAKSVNRLAQSWSRRKPCVIFPLPAYLRYAKDGENCIIVETAEQAVEQIERLSKDADLRARLGNAGWATAMEHLNPKTLVKKFLDALGGVCPVYKFDPQTKLQIIVPHYAPSKTYLQQCLDSIIKADLPDTDVIVVSSSRVSPAELLPDGYFKKHSGTLNIRLHYSTERLSFSEANNLGIKNAVDNASHFLFLNDDAILSKTAIVDYFRVLNGRTDIILNPYSNCDKGWLHTDELIVTKSDGRSVNLHPGMVHEQTADFLEELSDYRPSTDTTLIQSSFCAFYATLIPNKILRSVGLLSAEYSNGGEDVDYCYRAHKLGFLTCWTRAAWVFHYGGKSRKVSHDENPTKHIEEDKYNNELLYKKWPLRSSTKRLAIWTGPAWEKWGLDSHLLGGIGGSETCAARLAQTAAENGWQVTLIGEHDTHYDAKVSLVDWRSENMEWEYFDTFIASRNLSPIDWKLKAKKILVWIHDIWLLSGQEIHPYFKSRVHKFVTLSPWHKAFVKNHHKLEDSNLTVVPNGVNIELFQDNAAVKEWGRLHYSSSPDRGLDNILNMLPHVIDECPETKLHIYYGFYNWESAAKSRNNEDELKRIDDLKNQISSFGDRIVMHGRKSQPLLAQEWAKAWLWWYPTNFTETFCITAKEAQASKTPILSSSVGALASTVGEYGIQVGGHPYSESARNQYVEYFKKLYEDKSYWQEWSDKAYAGASSVSWGDVYQNYWKSLIA